MLKINIVNSASFSIHRSGWSYVVGCLKHLQSCGGITVNDFIEKTFSWDLDNFYYNKKNFVIPYKKPWIGFFHNPPNMPPWFDYYNSPQTIMKREIFQESLKTCKAIVVLSKYMKDWLSQQVDIPVIEMVHPTEFVENGWSPYKFFTSQKTVVQLGWWLRDVSTITLFPKYLNRVWLNGDEHIGVKALSFNSQVNGLLYLYQQRSWEGISIPKRLENDDYDDLLSRSIAVINLYDSSANNSIIECMVRNTPMIINKLPAVIEYLGEDYPLYCDFTAKGIENCLNNDIIYETHSYLKNLDKERLKGEYFVRDFVEKISAATC